MDSTERPAASPDDAKAVFDSIVAVGGKPSLRNIANALNASAKYSPVTYQMVGRWKKQGWKLGPNSPGPTPVERADAVVDTVVIPAVTGDPTARAAHVEGILQRLPEVEAFAEQLANEPASVLLSMKLRQRLISSILVERMMQARLEQLIETPAVLSVLESGLAGTTGALMIAARQEQEVRAAAATVIEHQADEPLMSFVEPPPADEEAA